MDAKKIGGRLRKYRGERSIHSVAEEVGVSDSALYMYECGARVPLDDIKVKLANCFNTTVQELFYQE